MRYRYWFRPILPMCDELDNKIHGHTRKKDKVWRHYASEITYANMSYNNVTILVSYIEKIITVRINFVILSLIILLLILFI